MKYKPVVFEFATLRLEQERRVRIHGDIMNEFNATTKTAGERHASDIVRHEFERAGLTPPSPSEVGTRPGIPPGQMTELMAELLRDKVLVGLGSDSLCADRRLLEAVAEQMRAMSGRQIDVRSFKQHRRVADVRRPLLEYLDRERITLMQGDKRRML